MVKKAFLGVMLVMVLAFGMMVVGCEQEKKDGSADIIIKNEHDQYIITNVKITNYSTYYIREIYDPNISISYWDSKTYNITWDNVGSNGTQQDLNVDISSTGPNYSGSVDVNHGKTTIITLKSDGTFSVYNN